MDVDVSKMIHPLFSKQSYTKMYVINSHCANTLYTILFLFVKIRQQIKLHFKLTYTTLCVGDVDGGGRGNID